VGQSIWTLNLGVIKIGLYKHIQKAWKQPKKNLKDLWKQRLIKWRRTNSIEKIERPTRLDRARSLGYKAKQGYLIVRVRLPRGGRQRELFKSGRRSKARRRMKVLSLSYQTVAEQRANKKYPNCEVLNSYYVAKDGKYAWYEIILIERTQVSRYKNMEWVKNSKGRVYRGLTSSGRRSRGILTNKGKGAEKLRPSLKAHGRRGN
jgi:large subunit ribosomal protein L15e